MGFCHHIDTVTCDNCRPKFRHDFPWPWQRPTTDMGETALADEVRKLHERIAALEAWQQKAPDGHTGFGSAGTAGQRRVVPTQEAAVNDLIMREAEVRQRYDQLEDDFHALLAFAAKLVKAAREALAEYAYIDDPTGSLERHCERFYLETGFTAPCSSRPLAMGGQDEKAAQEAWRQWCNKRVEGVRDGLRAVLAEVPPAVAERLRENGNHPGIPDRSQEGGRDE